MVSNVITLKVNMISPGVPINRVQKQRQLQLFTSFNDRKTDFRIALCQQEDTMIPALPSLTSVLFTASYISILLKTFISFGIKLS